MNEKAEVYEWKEMSSAGKSSAVLAKSAQGTGVHKVTKKAFLSWFVTEHGLYSRDKTQTV